MDIPAVASPQTYLPKAQERFERAAERVVATTAAAADPAPQEGADDTASAQVAMREEALVNQMLFATARRQDDMAKAQADIIR